MTIRLFSDDSVVFEPPAIEQSTRGLQPIGICCGALVAFVVAIVLACASVWSPPPWLQPSIIGMLWASLFLMGAAAGSVRRGSMFFACAACSYVWMSHIAMQNLTSLVAAECSLVVCCSFAAGWFVTQLEFSGRSNNESVASLQRYQQWTIWDIALVTAFVAVVCYGLPRLESTIPLLSQVAFVLWGGCLFSWLAYRWVFDDCWTIGKLTTMLLGSVICFWILCRQTPTDLSLPGIILWMLSGPLAVVAAQGLTVLTLLTSIRVDQGSLVRERLNRVRSQFNVI